MVQPHSRRAVVSTLLLFILLTAGPAAAWGGVSAPRTVVEVVPYSWQIQAVATRGTTGRDNDLALAANGDPRISYFEVAAFPSGARYELMYTAWDGVRWVTELVDDRVDKTQQQQTRDNTSLALDEAGNPRIAYVDSANLMYAQRNGGAWQIEEVDPGTVETIAQASLALDAGGRPHISYYKGDELWYAAWTRGAWTVERVDSGSAGLFNSLALDGDGHPRISYLDLATVGSDALKYAAFNGATWNIQVVDASAHLFGPTALALTAGDSPRIGYVTYAGAVMYAAWTGSAWVTQTVANLGINYLDLDLALDASDGPHLLYSGSLSTSVALTHAYRLGENWQTQQIDRADEHMGADNALALDAQGYVHASYVADDYHDLRYAAWAPFWITQTIAGGVSVVATDIQVHAAAPQILFHNQSTQGLNLTSWDGDWPLTTLDTVSATVPSLSLALGDQRTYLTYYDPDTQRLLYANWNGHAWGYQEIATGANVGRYSQVVLGGEYGGGLRIAFWDGAALRVKVAELGGPGGSVILHSNLVGPALNANSGRLSAAHMAAGKVGVAYYDAGNADIRVAVWDPETDGWTDELVAGASSNAGPWNALQTDAASGGLVLAYYDATADEIEYTYQMSGTWHLDAPAVTAAGTLTSLSLELGLNSGERPRIAYTRQGDGGLYLVSRPLGTWLQETVTTGSPALGSASLALDERAHLAYADGGLMYAYRTATLDIAAPAPGASPLPINWPYNPLDACRATIDFVMGTEPSEAAESFGARASTVTAEAGPLDDLEIMEGITDLFATSPAGQDYTDLYAQYGGEMGQIGIDHPDLLWDAGGTLQNFLPGLEALVTGRGSQQVVTQEMVDDALDIWQRLAGYGSPGLAAAINARLAQYHNLQDFVGLTFDEWSDIIGVPPPSHQIYLPLVARAGP